MQVTWKQSTITLALIITLIPVLGGRSISGPNSQTVFGPVTVPDFNIPYHTVVTDQHGFIYLAGPATDDLNVTSDSYDTTYNGGEYDIFLAKFAPNSTAPLAVTLVGGSGNEWCRAMMVDHKGNIILSGSTNSPDFALDGRPGDLGVVKEEVVFVVRFDENLKLLEGVKLLGPGEGFAMAENQDKTIYVAGRADSSAFPPGKGWDRTYNGGGSDAFVARLNEGLDTIINVSFLGGNSRELALSMTTSKTGDVLVAGFTDSTDFPKTDTTFTNAPANRNGNGFVAKFSSDLNSLLAAAQLGGKDHDVIHSLALGKDESLYLTGLTLSPDFPVTSGSFDESYNGDADIFVSRIAANLEEVIVSTFLGGGGRDWGYSLIVNPDQSVVIAGDTDSPDFPDLTGIDEESRKENVGDIVIVQLNKELTALNNTIRAGGSLNDRVPVMAKDFNSNKVIAGLSNSTDFPVEPPGNKVLQGKGYNLFLTYIAQPLPKEK